jgi:hypothetical protein
MGFMKWIGDRLGLNAPEVKQPQIDPTKAANNEELQKYVLNMVSRYKNYNPYGNSTDGTPQYFGMHKYYQPKSLDPATLKAQQERVAAVGGAGNTALDAHTQSGDFLQSGGYDPMMKALAYEQITRGSDRLQDQEMKDMTEMFGGRGVMRSSAMVGKANEVRSRGSDRKANAIGSLALADLQEARSAERADIDQAQGLDVKNYKAMQDALNFGQQQSSGSQFTQQSMLDYENSQAKRKAWDDRWNTIIGAAGSFF